MKVTTITEAKNQLSALLDRVRAGETILISDRGVPVALLEPPMWAGAGDPGGRVSRLARSGVLRPGRAKPPLRLLRTPPPRAKRGASAVRALLQERGEGR